MHQQVLKLSSCRVSSVLTNKYSVSMAPIHYTTAKPRAGLVLWLCGGRDWYPRGTSGNEWRIASQSIKSKLCTAFIHSCPVLSPLSCSSSTHAYMLNEGNKHLVLLYSGLPTHPFAETLGLPPVICMPVFTSNFLFGHMTNLGYLWSNLMEALDGWID